AVGTFEIAGGHGTGNRLKKGAPGTGRAMWLRPRSRFLLLQRTRHFGALEALDLVARLDVVVLLHGDAALHAVAHFVDQFLEAAQRFQFALEDHHVVAQHADRLAALDRAFSDHATGHGAELGAAEYVAHFGDADDVLAHLHAQQASGRLRHLVDHVVDDREIAYVQAVGLDDLACRRIGAHVETDDQRLRCGGQCGVRLGDAADTGRNHVDAHALVADLRERFAQSLDRTLHVALDQDVERLLLFTLPHLGDDVLKPVGLADHARFAPLLLAFLGDLACQPLILDADKIVTGFRYAGQSEHLHGNRRAGFGHLLA